MTKTSFFSVAIVASLVVAAAVGCSKSRIKGLVPAEGTVVFNGAPVEGASVMFAPKKIDPSSQAGSASATTDKNGKFKMTTLDPGDGLFPGEYYVTVSKDRVEGGPTLEDARRSPDEFKGASKVEVSEQTTIRELPAKYSDMNASGLDVEIPAGGKKDVTFNLEGEVDLTPIQMDTQRGSAPGIR